MMTVNMANMIVTSSRMIYRAIILVQFITVVTDIVAAIAVGKMIKGHRTRGRIFSIIS